MTPTGGYAAKVGRVRLEVIPPGQSRDVAAPELDARLFSHSICPRSMSSVKIFSELPPTNPSERNPRYPIKKSNSAGGVNESSCLASFDSLIFQTSSKPGFPIVATEIFGSPRTQDERWLSWPMVIQSGGRWANSELLAPSAQTANTTERTNLCMPRKLLLTTPDVTTALASSMTCRKSPKRTTSAVR